MSGGTACANRREHFSAWWVSTYKANYSTFSGGRRTPSAYSEVNCDECSARWRTRAAYVEQLPVRGYTLTSRRSSG